VSIPRFITAAALSLAFAPLAASAQREATVFAQATAPSEADMKVALKNALAGVNLTPQQKRHIGPMVRNYETQTANADPATTKAAKETLIANIYGVLTPTQQQQFRASMKAQLGK
jgi:Spy/CpxP family protein refolding chaperone